MDKILPIALITISTIAFLSFLKVKSYKKSTNTLSIRISLSPSVVFQYLENPKQLLRWVEGLQEINSIKITDNKIGSRSSIKISLNGTVFEVEEEIIEFQKDKKIITKMNLKNVFESTVTYELFPMDNNRLTEIRFKEVAQYHSIIAKLIDFYITSEGQKKVERDFAKLKKIAENDNIYLAP